MNWAFWRRRKPRATGPGRTDARQSGPAARSDESSVDDGGGRAGQAARMRVRMRRRLIGAAALLLGTAVVVPMMLDPAPRPLPDSIPIDIPSERTPFSPRLTLPSDSGSPAAAPAAGHGGSEPVDEPPTPAPGETAPPAPADRKSGAADAEPAATAMPAAAAPAHAEQARWIVQAAALSNEGAARQLSERLSKAGMAPFVERTGSGAAVLYRVRLGPFSSREAAGRTRKHLHAMGVGSNVVRLGPAGR
jgi:DedD protein